MLKCVSIVTLCLVTFTFASSEITSNLSDIITDDDVRALTIEFIRLCPKTELCKVNRSIADNEFYSVFACCKPCRCDPECLTTRDCCPDILRRVPDVTDDVSTFTEICVNMQYKNDTSSDYARGYKVIGRCPPDYKNRDVADKCKREYKDFDFGEGLTGFVPVTDLHTKRVFKSSHCLKCNGGSTGPILQWDIVIQCKHRKQYLLYPQMLARLLDNDKCDVFFEQVQLGLDSIPHLRRCKRTIDKCNVTGSVDHIDMFVERFCLSYTSVYKEYKNIHCALCNGMNDSEIDHMCPPDITIVEPTTFKATVDNRLFLYEKRENRSTDEMNNDDIQNCTSADIFDVNREPVTCIVRHCPKTTYLYGLNCRPIYREASDYSVEMRLRFHPKGFVYLSDTFIKNLPNVTEAMLNEFKKTETETRVIKQFAYDISVKIDATLTEIYSVNTKQTVEVIYVELHLALQAINVKSIANFVEECLNLYRSDFGQQDVYQVEFIGTGYGLLRPVLEFKMVHLDLDLPIHTQQIVGALSFHLDDDQKTVLRLKKAQLAIGLTPYETVFLSPFVNCSQIVLDSSQFRRRMKRDGTVHLEVLGKKVKLSKVAFVETYQHLIMCEQEFNILFFLRSGHNPTTETTKIRNSSSGAKKNLINFQVILVMHTVLRIWLFTMSGFVWFHF